LNRVQDLSESTPKLCGRKFPNFISLFDTKFSQFVLLAYEDKGRCYGLHFSDFTLGWKSFIANAFITQVHTNIACVLSQLHIHNSSAMTSLKT
jgi:hypothetical protein